MSDADSQHKRTRSSAALALLRRKEGRNDDDGASDDGTQSSMSTRPTTAQSPAGIPANARGHNSRASLSRVPSSQPGGAPSTRSNAAPNDKGTTLEQSVRKFRVVEALRSGNTAAISRAIRESSEGGPRASISSLNGIVPTPLEETTVLHLAIQCAEFDVVEFVLSNGRAHIDVNARDKDGNTPLHVAAIQGRVPIVKLLLQEKEINDAIANNQGKLALDVARNPEIFQQLQLSRTLFVQEKVKQVQDLIRKGQYEELGAILEEPRVKTILDVNSIELPSDVTTVQAGGTLLHEAARKRDTKLIQVLLLHGADPFQRDRKGKLPQDVTKDDITRAMLKKSPEAVAAQRGIQEKAVLGHAASQAGAGTATAGEPLPGRDPTMKGYLKKWTNYRKGYQLRWFVLENGVLSYYKHQDDAENACRGAISMRIAKLHMSPDEKTKFEIIGKSSVKYTLKANHEVEAKRWFWALNNAIQWMKDQAKEEEKHKAQSAELLRQVTDQYTSKSSDVSINEPSEAPSEPRHSTSLSRHQSAKTAGSRAAFSRASTSGSVDDEFLDAATTEDLAKARSNVEHPGTVDMDEDEYDGEISETNNEVPSATKDAFNITAQSAKLQLDTLAQVSASLQAEASRNPTMSLVDPKAAQALATYDAAIKSLKGLMGDLLRISKDRDAHWQYQLDQEIEMRQMWEESMAKVAKEQEALEARVGEAEHKRKMTKRALREVIEGGSDVGRPGSSYSFHPTSSDLAGANEDEDIDGQKSPTGRSLLRKGTVLSQVADIAEDSESDGEEFFDAVDAGDIEVEKFPPAEGLSSQGAEQSLVVSGTDISSSYSGYENGIRNKLPNLDNDNRPKISLWAILKSMIGKDMTKMTLPVTFNEPTSLLYRCGEDMEYAELLDSAAQRSDSIERMLYVATFAASEYGSTVGRVAKPFNPLLGETFEYVRPDKGYRFFIEQVSHHPPVGAAWAESANWTYYGESAVKSKFYGKSFDINPLGTWFLKLRPIAGGKEELYTWKKVTSSVVGIITGNPVVDNYGPMEIKNWTTGETCLFDFKPRGWKASSAYLISGKITDESGRVRVSLGGRWNSKIYARITPGYEAAVEEPADGSSVYRGSINDTTKAFLIWQAHERPTNIPFNLTPFVLTFNHIDDKLTQWIAPTDSRYRPDQRAMEDGEYDFAATEKNRLEEEQRARRKMREARGDDFIPAWFSKARCPTTGEEFWKFNEKYWEQREKFGKGDKGAWDNLEPIFANSSKN